jgi:hypothetical protein
LHLLGRETWRKSGASHVTHSLEVLPKVLAVVDSSGDRNLKLQHCLRKDRFGVTPKPARETHALSRAIAAPFNKGASLCELAILARPQI